MKTIYDGVIEDITDPLKLGRVRVRVFGLHSDDRSLIPVDTLPWATVLMPSTSASMSGIGTSPHGLLCGSWVSLYFKDKDNQYPIVIGSTHGIPADITSQSTAEEEVEFTDSEAPTEQNALKDSSGNTVTDGSGAPIKTTPPVKDPSTPSKLNAKVIPAELGAISSKYESNGNPGTINRYADGRDLGGASYGAYQFASYLKGPNEPTHSTVTASQISNSPVKRYIRSSSFGSNFTNLEPATKAFDDVWIGLGVTNRVEFLADQHAYIERNYYQVAAGKLSADITNRGKAIHEAIWSMSVQLGPGGAANKISSVLGSPDKNVCDDKLIDILYTSRINTVRDDFRSSPGLWNGLISRFNSEKADLIKLAKTYQTAECGQATVTEETKPIYNQTEKTAVVVKKVVSTSTRKQGDRGFNDPNKKYPLYYNEADTHRLSRGILTGTIVETKRANVVVNKEAGVTSISEPTTQYNTKYPFNKVTVTESGHIIEMDDTPGHERIHIYHRSGSFIEMHPDGKIVTKAKDSSTLVVNTDDNTIVIGNQNASVDGNRNETIGGNLTLIVYGNSTVTVNGDSSLTATGTVNIKGSAINLN